MDTPIRDRDGRAVGEAQAVKHFDRQRKAFPTIGANQVPDKRQARLHRATTSTGADATVLVMAGGAL